MPDFPRWGIPLLSRGTMLLTLSKQNPLFVVGPNGSGKSALIQHAVTAFGAENVKRISAHRQTWLASGTVDMTPAARKQFETTLKGREPNPVYRWRQWDPNGRLSSVLFDLTAKDNDLARRITKHAYTRNQEEVNRIVNTEPLVFDQINSLLQLAGLAVTIENSAGEDIIARHENSSNPYSMAEMSDGERNAAILAADVLTTPSQKVLLIDEPERHLHRSIIEPLLSALFALRPDCYFIVATHELALPLSNPDAPVLVLRSCHWKDTQARWDIQYLSKDKGLPEGLRPAVLGARNTLLFVEGEPQSLDTPLYNALFPRISVIPIGGSENVIHSVRGLSNTQRFHDVSAFGLIDRDSRPNDNISDLERDRIFALRHYSVESLYYCEEAIGAVAAWQQISLGQDAEGMIKEARKAALSVLMGDELAQRMAARRCEGSVRNHIQSRMPVWREIMNDSIETLCVPIATSFQEELSHYRTLVNSERVTEIIGRYPIRETGVFSHIAKALQLTRTNYEKTVLTRILNDPKLADRLRQRIGPLSHALYANS